MVRYLLCITIIFTSLLAHTDIRYEIHRGNIDEHTIKQLPKLVQVYEEYPYLCVFTLEQAQRWAGHMSSEEGIWSAAYDGNILVGAMLAMPAREESDPMLLSHSEFVHGKALMLEEAMVALQYQKQGIGRELIRLLLQEAVTQGYTDVYLLTVVRSHNHPLKPKDFIDLDIVWSRLGWLPTHLTGIRQWPTRCGVSDNECVARIDNMVEYWHKKLNR